VNYEVTVSYPDPVEGEAGDTVQLTVMEDGVDVTADSGTSYSVDDTAIATIDAPTLTGISPATISRNDSSVTFTLTGTNARTSGQTLQGLPTGVTQSGFAQASSTTWTVSLGASGSATLGAADVYIGDSDHGDSESSTITVASAAPTLASVSPDTIDQGDSGTYTFSGTHFRSGQTIGGLPTGVTASSLVVVSGTSITATLTASGSASLGASNVYIVDSTYGNSGTEVLTVDAGGSSGIPVTSGLVLQLEADHADVTTNLAAVGTLYDQSSTGVDFTQSVSGNKPTLLTNVTSTGMALIDFEASQWLTAGAYNAALGGTAGTIFTVMAVVNTLSTDRNVFSNRASATSGYRQFISRGASADGPRFGIANGTSETSIGEIGRDSILHNICATFNTSLPSTYVDGTAVDLAGGVGFLPNTTVRCALGTDSANVGTLTGQFYWGAVYVFNRVLNSTELGLMNTWIQDKWGTP
jgi:hypothetical protein